MYQQITFIGYLGADPEMRYTPSGTPVTSFSVAVNKSWVDGNGERQQKATWFRVSAWQKLAEACSKYLTKGRAVLVVGEVEEAKAFTDRDGNLRASIEVRAQTVRFLNDGETAPYPNGQSGNNMESVATPTVAPTQYVADDEIPF